MATTTVRTVVAVSNSSVITTRPRFSVTVGLTCSFIPAPFSILDLLGILVAAAVRPFLSNHCSDHDGSPERGYCEQNLSDGCTSLLRVSCLRCLIHYSSFLFS